MSKKILRTVGKIAGVVAAVAMIGTGIGAALGGTMLLSIGGVSVAASAIAGAASLVSLGASLLTKPKSPKIGAANEERLQLSLDVRTPRKMAFGTTALGTDLRDQEFTGTDKEYLHRFVVVAAHKVQAIKQIWFDDQLAWTVAGGVQAPFSGYLTVTPVLEGGPGNAINISARLGSSRRFTGCAYVYFRFKLTGNSKKTESPFAQQVPTRITIIGDGIRCYDPRQDSTVPGGEGNHRADDQSTWTWGDHCHNTACQLATWLLGWRIQNPQSETWKLSVGAGIPPERIDWPSFVEGANLCDEDVALSAGGTEPRYRSGGLVDEDDGPLAILEAFKAAMNADLDDQDGLIRLTVFHNDLATPDADFTEADVQGEYLWHQTQPLNESFNVVRGNYVEPDTLYQPAPYLEAAVPSPDGIERVHPADFGLVQSRGQAERLAKQRLQRQLYGGEFRATFLASAWKVHKNTLVRLTFAPEGWVNKLFRVAEYEVRQDGLVPMVLREEHEDIYAWDAEESPAVVLAEPTEYLPGEAPIPQFLGTIEEGADVTGNHTSADTANVNGRPSTEVTGLIDAHTSALSQLDTDMAAAEAALAAAQADLAAAQAELDQAEADILAAQGDIANLFTASAETDSAVSAARAQAQAGLDQIAAALVQAQTDLAAQRAIMRDAGISVDPATGQVRLHAFDRSEERLNAVDIRLDAVDAEILLKASTTYVDQKISEAVLDPSQLAELDELYTRMATAELELDGLDAEVQLRATLIEVSAIEGRVTTAESDISALEGQIATKVDTTTFDALETRVDSAESTLSAIDGASITEAVRTARVLSSSADEQDAAGLSALLTGDAAKRDQVAAVAEARRELTAKIVDDVSAEASARQALAVRVGAAEASIVSESLARVAQDSVLAGQITVVSADLDDVSATVTTQGTAIASLESSYASLSSTVSTQGSTIASQGTAITNLQGNYASLSSTVTALGSDLDAVEASVTQNATAINNLDGDFASLSSTVSTLNSTVSTQGSAISTLQSSTASLQSTVSAQGTTVSEHSAAITALEGDVETMAARWAVVIDVNGRIVGRVKLDGSGETSSFDILADAFRVTDPDGGPAMTWQDGILWNRGATISIILGQDFGATSDLLLWAGPNPASAAAATKGDGVFWIDNAGNAFFGGFAGAQDAGTLTFSVRHDSPPSAGYLTMAGGVLTLIPSGTEVDLLAIPRAYGFGFGTGQNVSYRVKWQYSADKTTWTDVGSPSAVSTWLGDSGGVGTTQAGAPANATKTGLTAGVLAHFRPLYEITAGSALITGGRTFNLWVEGSADGS